MLQEELQGRDADLSDMTERLQELVRAKDSRQAKEAFENSRLRKELLEATGQAKQLDGSLVQKEVAGPPPSASASLPLWTAPSPPTPRPQSGELSLLAPNPPWVPSSGPLCSASSVQCCGGSGVGVMEDEDLRELMIFSHLLNVMECL